MKKVCPVCRKELPLESFNKATKARDGRQSTCRKCDNARNKVWYQANKESVIARTRRYNKEHPEQYKASSRKWSQRNKEYYRLQQLKYRKEHPDRVKATEAKRNQTESRKHSYRLKEYRRKGAIGNHTKEEWLAKLAEYQYTCTYCDSTATTRDHRIPIIRGGTNFIDNIVPACFSCNSSKGSKTDDEYIFWKRNKSPRLYGERATN